MAFEKVLDEYLVRLGADVDTGSFQAAATAINQLVDMLKKVKGLAAAGALASAFVAVGKAAIDTIKSTADADMQFRRLASQMWITRDSAKALSTAMKVMGVSEEDIAWVPELREQFFRLRQEMNELATPEDADRQLKWIREIGYDIQSLQVKLKMLKEWVAYYLIKYLGPFIREFQDFIRWLNDKLGKNMPAIAKKIAAFLSRIVSMGVSAIKVIKSIIGAVYDFIDGLPANVKRMGAVMATVGAFILAGPFGKFIMALGGIMLLLEDFVYYMNGWNSSKTLAPIWGKLLQFLEGDTLKTVGGAIKEILSTAADLLEYILKLLGEIVSDFMEGIDWEGIEKSWKDGLSELASGVDELWQAIKHLFHELGVSTDNQHREKQRSFWKGIGSYVSDAVKSLGKFVGVMGKIAHAMALMFKGDFAGAARVLLGVIADAAKASPWGKAVGAVLGQSADEKKNSAQAMARLKAGGLSAEGAAAVIGNLSAESGVDPSNVQDVKGGPSDDEYLQGIESGTIDRETFATDGLGFGIAQWTEPGRKRALWDFAAERGVPINDLNMQVDFLLQELGENYRGLYEYLREEGLDVYEATRKVLEEYEAPADTGYSVQVDRGNRAQTVYDDYGNMPAASNGFISPNSYAYTAAAGNGFMAAPSTYSDTTYGGTSIGNITTNVYVSQPNATADDIGKAVSRVFSAHNGRGWSV